MRLKSVRPFHPAFEQEGFENSCYREENSRNPGVRFCLGIKFPGRRDSFFFIATERNPFRFHMGIKDSNGCKISLIVYRPEVFKESK
jgi:hypothetical protein